MKIPQKIKIGGHYYNVKFPYVFTERLDRSGDIDHEGATIRVAGNTSEGPRAKSAIAVTFIHEILHGLDHLSGCRIFDGGDLEKKVEALSEGIYQVLADNGFLDKKPEGLATFKSGDNFKERKMKVLFLSDSNGHEIHNPHATLVEIPDSITIETLKMFEKSQVGVNRMGGSWRTIEKDSGLKFKVISSGRGSDYTGKDFDYAYKLISGNY